MQMKPLLPAALCALLVASPFAMAQETRDPAATAAAAGSPPVSDMAQPGTEAQPMAPSSGPGMMGGQPGSGCPMMGGGMMKRMGKGTMMGAQQEEGSEMMRMMNGGKRGGMGMMAGMQQGAAGGGKGHGMPDHYKRLMGRLDLLEARMAKMETMLERLLER